MKKHRKPLLKQRKKGNAILEFIVILPVFVFMGWGLMQIMFYLLTQSTAHEVAMETARVVSLEMRGNTKELQDLSPDKQESLKQLIYEHSSQIGSFNGLFLLFRDDKGNLLSEAESLANITFATQSTCSQMVANNKRTICVYTNRTKTGTTGLSQEQIVTKVKGPFKVNGSFIPLDGTLFGASTGVSQKEIAGRFEYVE